MTTATHPAESLELLSRHHDGELSASERAAFEAHLAECPECREAAAAFERSLVAFRSAPESPVPYDLSARILRKIRAQSPSRRPFGIMFGIDVRWAGVFMAALLVAIIAPELLSRRERAKAPAAPEPLTAYVVETETDKAKAGASRSKPNPAAEEAPKVAAAAPEPPERQRRELRAAAPSESAAGQTAAQAAPAPPATAPAAPEASAGFITQKPQPAEGARNAAPAPPAPASSSVARRAAPATTDRLGGEAGAFAKEEAQAEEVRIDVRSLDSDGSAPDVLQAPPADRLAPLRGREYVLIVEADGFVRGVEPAPRRQDEKKSLLKDASADASASDASDAPLRQLRFRSTGKVRRLLVQIR